MKKLLSVVGVKGKSKNREALISQGFSNERLFIKLKGNPYLRRVTFPWKVFSSLLAVTTSTLYT